MARTPLEQLVADFLAHNRPKWSEHSYSGVYQPRLERIWLPWCRKAGVKTIEQVTQKVIDNWTGDMLKNGGARGPLSRTSVNSYSRTVNVFLNWARKEGDLKAPTRVVLTKVPKRNIEILTDEEIKAMEKYCDDRREKRNGLIVRILAQTGVRAAELLGLTINSMHEGGDRHTYLRVIGKGDEERDVVITPELAKEIRGYVRQTRPATADTDALFISQRKRAGGRYQPMTVSGLDQVIRYTAKEAGIARRVYPHLFRHSYISHMMMRRVDSIVIRNAVGHHSSRMIDEVYGHIRGQDTADILLDALEKRPR
jgi:integrase/recombinase XerD